MAQMEIRQLPPICFKRKASTSCLLSYPAHGKHHFRTEMLLNMAMCMPLLSAGRVEGGEVETKAKKYDF